MRQVELSIPPMHTRGCLVRVDWERETVSATHSMAQKVQTQKCHCKTVIQSSTKFSYSTQGSSVKPSSKKPFKVALVDEQATVRESWCKFINSFPDFACVCACSTGEEALRKFPQHQPDVVLVDIFLPQMSGIECTRRLKALLPKTQIVMLTAMEDMEWVFRALQAGADGYLLKRTTPADLRLALLDVLNGGAPLTNLIARRVIASFRQKAKLRDPSPPLTVREEQILRLLTQGHSNRLIAKKLALSIDTVCSHLKKIFTKLQVSSRTQAVVRYMASQNAPEARCLP
jgi:DNA-binding NarL/FixJ family response regulator